MRRKLKLSAILALTITFAACADKWSIIYSALDGAPALIASFNVKPEIAKELTADFAAIKTAVQALQAHKGTAQAVADAIDKLSADGSRLLQGQAGARVTAIVAFLRPFFPSSQAGPMEMPSREPTKADAEELKRLMKPLGK